jgi:2'-5' RNA ligase
MSDNHSDSRRLFFALWPDDEVRHALFRWQTANLPADVRWQHRADLHITLHFLGQTPVARIQALRQLASDVSTEGFTLVLDQIGHWPGPRVLWAGPHKVPGALSALHGRLGERLQANGFAIEERAYRPHVTLARKMSRAGDYRPLPPITWGVRELVLVESRPGDAPMYHPIGRWSPS